MSKLLWNSQHTTGISNVLYFTTSSHTLKIHFVFVITPSKMNFISRWRWHTVIPTRFTSKWIPNTKEYNTQHALDVIPKPSLFKKDALKNIIATFSVLKLTVAWHTFLTKNCIKRISICSFRISKAQISSALYDLEQISGSSLVCGKDNNNKRSLRLRWELWKAWRQERTPCEWGFGKTSKHLSSYRKRDIKLNFVKKLLLT